MSDDARKLVREKFKPLCDEHADWCLRGIERHNARGAHIPERR